MFVNHYATVATALSSLLSIIERFSYSIAGMKIILYSSLKTLSDHNTTWSDITDVALTY